MTLSGSVLERSRNAKHEQRFAVYCFHRKHCKMEAERDESGSQKPEKHQKTVAPPSEKEQDRFTEKPSHAEHHAAIQDSLV